ncbi:hypothetical protein SAMN05444714_2894 [Yoonia litorea]|uniref:Uncharacterized protein n=1 Tax=Yoonia litorea TaxID=1123755 RepID=A0A1I6N149_9RHOB|nr:hypothetical protein SAMN05444714_2894 [Yoonia litorea]
MRLFKRLQDCIVAHMMNCAHITSSALSGLLLRDILLLSSL